MQRRKKSKRKIEETQPIFKGSHKLSEMLGAIYLNLRC